MSILLLFSRIANAPTTAIVMINTAMAQIMTTPIESAAKAHKMVFITYVVWLVLAAVVTTVFTWRVWSSGNAVQDAVREDALARIAEAKAKGDQANLEAEQIKQQMSWRTISPEQFHKMGAIVASPEADLPPGTIGLGSIFLMGIKGDPEADNLMLPIAVLFSSSPHWMFKAEGQNENPVPPTGITVSGTPEAVKFVCSVLKAGGLEVFPMPYGNQPKGVEWARILVAHKTPPPWVIEQLKNAVP